MVMMRWGVCCLEALARQREWMNECVIKIIKHLENYLYNVNRIAKQKSVLSFPKLTFLLLFFSFFFFAFVVFHKSCNVMAPTDRNACVCPRIERKMKRNKYEARRTEILLFLQSDEGRKAARTQKKWKRKCCQYVVALTMWNVIHAYMQDGNGWWWGKGDDGRGQWICAT